MIIQCGYHVTLWNVCKNWIEFLLALPGLLTILWKKIPSLPKKNYSCDTHPFDGNLLLKGFVQENKYLTASLFARDQTDVNGLCHRWQCWLVVSHNEKVTMFVYSDRSILLSVTFISVKSTVSKQLRYRYRFDLLLDREMLKPGELLTC